MFFEAKHLQIYGFPLQCLHSGRLPNDPRENEFMLDEAHAGKRPSLLGTPPKNLKPYGNKFEDDNWGNERPARR